MSYFLTAFSAKDIGGRDEQQDSVVHLLSADNKRALLVLADGMGGHSGGAAASNCIAKATKIEWKNSEDVLNTHPSKILQNIFKHAYSCMQSLEAKEAISPRSTYVALIVKDNIAQYAHLGDSRLYHFRKNKLLNKTKDHSVVQMLVDMDNLDEEEMATHEDQGRLLKWVGGNREHELSLQSAEIMSNDKFLLCSDGLWEHVSIKQMEATFEKMDDLENIARSLITLAKQSGAENGDNISIAVLSAGEKNAESFFRKMLNKFVNKI